MTSGVFTFRTGLPLTIGETPDTSNAGSLAPRPDAIRNGNLPRDQRSPDLWFDTTAFQRQAPNTFGNAGVGTITDPGIANIDFALQKRFRVSESKQVEFRAEAFNLFNTPLFQGVSRTLGSSTFGRVTSSQYERELADGLEDLLLNSVIAANRATGALSRSSSRRLSGFTPCSMIQAGALQCISGNKSHAHSILRIAAFRFRLGM